MYRYVYGYVDFLDNRNGHMHFFDMMYGYRDRYFLDMVYWDWQGHVNLFNVMHRHVDLLHVMVMDCMYVVRYMNNMVIAEIMQLTVL